MVWKNIRKLHEKLQVCVFKNKYSKIFFYQLIFLCTMYSILWVNIERKKSLNYPLLNFWLKRKKSWRLLNCGYTNAWSHLFINPQITLSYINIQERLWNATNQRVDFRNRTANQKLINFKMLHAINERALIGRDPGGISKRED